MKKCRACGGENSNSEIYCDWCGEYLPNVEKATIFSFIRYFFHSFALLGILGAIIFYIANIINDSENLELLNQTIIGFSFKNVIQVGLFIGLLFFIILLGLLIVELFKIAKQGIAIKILLFLLLYFWIFSILILIFICKESIDLISLAIVANLVFIIYVEIYYYFLKNVNNFDKKKVRVGALTFISLLLFFLFLFLIPLIQNLINLGASIALPFESKPVLLGQFLNGAAIGFFIGLLAGILFITTVNYINMAKDIKKKCERHYHTVLAKIKK
jgi:hypothetical protein